MLNLLKAKWIFLGLEAPMISWLIVIALVVGAIYYWLKMRLGVFRPIGRQIELAKQKLAQIKPDDLSSKSGLDARSYDEVRRVFEENEILKPCWQGFSRRLIRRLGERGDFFWSAESAGAAFSESALIGSRLNLTLC